MMDKKRLEELKENCEFAIKHGHFMPEPDNVDLLALIDAALSRSEATTDADVQAAIEHQEEMLKSQRAWLETFNNLDKSDKVDAAIKDQQWHIRRSETVITALRAQIEPGKWARTDREARIAWNEAQKGGER